MALFPLYYKLSPYCLLAVFNFHCTSVSHSYTGLIRIRRIVNTKFNNQFLELSTKVLQNYWQHEYLMGFTKDVLFEKFLFEELYLLFMCLKLTDLYILYSFWFCIRNIHYYYYYSKEFSNLLILNHWVNIQH